MAILVNTLPPCILHEDEHLLVVNKPAGMNTHAPSPYAGEGIYDWLRHRESRWASLSILHRLDKETSGVMVFGKTPLANRSITRQFEERTVHKHYLLLTDRPVKPKSFTVVSTMVRAGEKYLSRPLHPSGERAETLFIPIDLNNVVGRNALAAWLANDNIALINPRWHWLIAIPLTGRTHQIRVHADAEGFPILGDTLYGGSPAPRLCLHAAELSLKHPATDQQVVYHAPVDFQSSTSASLRSAIIEPGHTNAFRVIHGASDGFLGWQVDRLGPYLLSQSEQPLSKERLELLKAMAPDNIGGAPHSPIQAIYHKTLTRHVRGTKTEEVLPRLVTGEPAPDRFVIMENGIRFGMSFAEGYSVGLFLDQRDNRRRFLLNHIAADFPLFPKGAAGCEVLNTFSYTCGFSVCAAKAGARVTSLDLSKKYLEWGKENFALNNMDPATHDFIYGDVFDWMRRLTKKGRHFDTIILDPPTFSQSKEHGVFQAERNYADLVRLSLPLLNPGGVLFASTNAAGLSPEKFIATLQETIQQAGRKIVRQHYVPQPPDFPISKNEPAYLKTVWLQISGIPMPSILQLSSEKTIQLPKTRP